MVNTIDPPASSPLSWRATMCRAASRAVKNAPSRLTAITRRQSSAVMSTKLDDRLLTPALTNTESTRPSSATVSVIAATTAASSLTSHTIDSTSTSYRLS